ncbi:MFS transporter [Streptomyces subrutilus]|uniref:MFS transporter n=1 Tax=Streptomyces subrutilus TaxID=36818 RepID=A0A5P2UEV2_9ACTN|nr:MFS transporter [Streptomyces subrutilus]
MGSGRWGRGGGAGGAGDGVFAAAEAVAHVGDGGRGEADFGDDLAQGGAGVAAQEFSGAFATARGVDGAGASVASDAVAGGVGGGLDELDRDGSAEGGAGGGRHRGRGAGRHAGPADRSEPAAGLGWALLVFSATTAVTWNSVYLTTSMGFFVALFVVLGAPGIGVFAGRMSIVQMYTSDATRGRVPASFQSVFDGFQALGMALAGVLVAHIGLPLALDVQAALLGTAGLLALWHSNPPRPAPGPLAPHPPRPPPAGTVSGVGRGRARGRGRAGCRRGAGEVLEDRSKSPWCGAHRPYSRHDLTI